LPYGLHPKGRPFESDSAHHTFQLPLHTLSVFCPCSPLGFGNLRRVVFLLCSFIPGTSRCTEAGSRATPFQASRIHRTLLPRQPTRSPRGNCMSAEAGSLIPSLGSIVHRRSKRESIDGSLSRNPSRFYLTERNRHAWVRWTGRALLAHAVVEHSYLAACNAGIAPVSQNCTPFGAF